MRCGAWIERALLVGVLAGCSGKDDSSPQVFDTGTTSPTSAACERRSDAGLDVVPGDSPDTTAPALQDLDSPWTVDLSATGGWIRLRFTEPGAYQLHAGFGGVVRSLYDDAGQVDLPEAVPNGACPSDIPEIYSFSVVSDTTWYLNLAPFEGRGLWLMTTASPTAAGLE